VDEEQSPAVLKKMVQAAIRNRSYVEGSRELRESAELAIGPKTLERVARKIGTERVAQRDAATEEFAELPLPEQHSGCPQPKAPAVAVVQFDCGRMLVRDRCATAESAADSRAPQEPARVEEAVHLTERITEAALANMAQCVEKPEEAESVGSEESPPETEKVDDCRSKHWRDSKVGCLLSMQSEQQDCDPCPEIPVSFLEIRRITELVRGMGHSVPAASANQAEDSVHSNSHDAPTRPGVPVPLVRTVLSSRACSQAFGAMLVAAAWARGFAAAPRKAFVADGAEMNWTTWARYFSHYVPILDFIHALQYVFAAAMAGQPFEKGWACYREWIQAVWCGGVEDVIAALSRRQEELGLPPKGVPATDPRKIVAVALGYLQTHWLRMDYPRYRRLGLPIMSCYVESTVKQINYRVKGTEKFWGDAGAEAVLQLRADYLSDTDPLTPFWRQRQKSATGQRYRCAV
jgi:hypothetical protein